MANTILMGMNLATAFSASTAQHKGQPAILWGDRTFRHEELWAESLKIAAHLGRMGVKPGDRVALWLKNCPEFIPAFFAILQAGGVVVPVNNFLKSAEVDYLLGDAGVNLIITDSTLLQSAQQLTLPNLQAWNIEDAAQLPPGTPFEQTARSESDLAVLIYTSGTTGKAKGAMLSHGNLLANVESCRIMLEAVDHDRFVVLLPLFHSFMMTVGMLLPVLIGGSMVLIKSLHPPKNIIAEILQHGATILPAIPQFFRTLAHAGLPPNQPLRLCVSGGAPLPGEILREFTARMHVPLIEGYGLSEASPVVSMNPLAGPWKEGSIGVPVPGVEMSVQDDAGQHLEPKQTGEICVRGANVMLGYWNQPDESSKALRSGWLLTGDIGHRDSDGYYYITDRKKDMLLVNGINVYPREIEEILYQFPGVKEAAVVGIPDPRRGEQAVAFISQTEGATVEEKALLHHLRAKLAEYKVPRRIIILSALPRNATGKILKTALRQSLKDAQPEPLPTT